MGEQLELWAAENTKKGTKLEGSLNAIYRGA